ncbi:MAG TPA: glycosyl hydrolase 53 family protein, partial [Polyangiaceae bacterium]
MQIATPANPKARKIAERENLCDALPQKRRALRESIFRTPIDPFIVIDLGEPNWGGSGAVMHIGKSSLSRLVGAIFTAALMPSCTLPAEEGVGAEFDEPIGSSQDAAAMTMLGADMSSVQRTLDLGKSFYDAAGVKKDPLDIIKGIGANYVRLRVWVNPASGYNNKAKVITYAKAAKAKGMKVL